MGVLIFIGGMLTGVGVFVIVLALLSMNGEDNDD